MRPHRFPMACEVRAGLHWLASGWLCGLFATVAAGQPVVTGQRVITGTVETVTSDGLTIRDAAGDVQSVRVQGKGEPGIALSDGTLLAATPLVRVSGECVVARLRPGRIVRFRCLLNDAGRADGTIRDLTVLDGDGVELGVRTVDPEGSDDDSASRYREREVTAAVKLAGPRRLVVELPADRAYARKTVLGVPLDGRPADGSRATTPPESSRGRGSSGSRRSGSPAAISSPGGSRSRIPRPGRSPIGGTIRWSGNIAASPTSRRPNRGWSVPRISRSSPMSPTVSGP